MEKDFLRRLWKLIKQLQDKFNSMALIHQNLFQMIEILSEKRDNVFQQIQIIRHLLRDHFTDFDQDEEEFDSLHFSSLTPIVHWFLLFRIITWNYDARVYGSTY